MQAAVNGCVSARRGGVGGGMQRHPGELLTLTCLESGGREVYHHSVAAAAVAGRHYSRGGAVGCGRLDGGMIPAYAGQGEAARWELLQSCGGAALNSLAQVPGEHGDTAVSALVEGSHDGLVGGAVAGVGSGLWAPK